ncbi:MAG TPA: hypothetical protein VK535_11905, partial [Gemmatimonadales bacterium]|nr:hypothetical protein [Gemmatimonadales bacterium]
MFSSSTYRAKFGTHRLALPKALYSVFSALSALSVLSAFSAFPLHAQGWIEIERPVDPALPPDVVRVGSEVRVTV